LQQVLINLMMNAFEAMRAVTNRSRELLVSTATSNGNVLVEVQDSGKGIDPQQRERIFEPFFTTKPLGIGIGLSISRSIVESHGGSLWVTSSSGGARFHFTLPEAGETL
jgi:signal transduction histidine kinase